MDESPNTMEQPQAQTQLASLIELLSDASRAFEVGNWQSAYRLSLEATRQDMGNIEAWLIRARTAPSNQEKLFCLSQVSRLAPDHPMARQELYTTLRSELEQSPFLAYMEETDQVYFVRSREYLALAVPKDRGIPENYPPERLQAIAKAYRWLGWSVAGLALAGLGTLVFAPLAIRQSASALSQPLQKPDRVRARFILVTSSLLFVIALFLAGLLLAHFPR